MNYTQIIKMDNVFCKVSHFFKSFSRIMLPFTIFPPHLFSLIPLSTSLSPSFSSPLLLFLPFSSHFSLLILSLLILFLLFSLSSFSPRYLAACLAAPPPRGSLDDRCSDTIRLHPILSGIATSEFCFEIFRFVSHS